MKNKTAANQIVCFLFIVLIVALLPISVWAQETTLTANVPFFHTLHIELIGKGQIVVDDVPYGTTADIQIERQSTPVVSVESDSGWIIKSVSLNGQNITQKIQNNSFVVPTMCDDTALIVVFEEQSSNPQTGDTNPIEILSLLMLLSISGMLLCVMLHRRTRTDSN